MNSFPSASTVPSRFGGALLAGLVCHGARCGDPLSFVPVQTTEITGSFTPRLTFFRTLPPDQRSVELMSPLGPLSLSYPSLGSIRALASADPGEPGFFQAPSVFSAPLPTGSGARALAQGGAFAALADDATAASWNPAGLMNLQRPEFSAVYRRTTVHNRHASTDPDLRVGTDSYDSEGLNHASVTTPLPWPVLGLNAVVSFNHQEAYDFTQVFHSGSSARDAQRFRRASSGVAHATQTDRFSFEGGRSFVEIIADITTRSSSRLEQSVRSTFDSRLSFVQQGVIEADSPALAVQVNKWLSLGAALNVYQDSPWAGRDIRGRTRVEYRSRTDSRAVITNEQSTDIAYRADLGIVIPSNPFNDGGEIRLPLESATLPTSTRREVLRESSVRVTDGVYEEVNRYGGVEGLNATFGALVEVNDLLNLGAAVDLPWTADATQTRSVRHETVNRDASGRVVDRRVEQRSDASDVGFDFPLFWHAGAMFHWHPDFHTSADVGQTRWSDFAYRSGGRKTNPLDGSEAGGIDDTWTVRLGAEWVKHLGWTDIPLRAGLLREERPALGSPDVYRGFSLGTGLSLGTGQRKIILDLAYHYLEADDVQTVLPEEPALSTDSVQHQVFGSVIVHF